MEDSVEWHARSGGAESPGGRTSHGTAGAVIASARRCIESATVKRIPADARARDLYASDVTFRELHACVEAYASALRSVGGRTDTGEEMLLAALREAAEPDEPHPALVSAVAAWFREAFASQPSE